MAWVRLTAFCSVLALVGCSKGKTPSLSRETRTPGAELASAESSTRQTVSIVALGDIPYDRDDEGQFGKLKKIVGSFTAESSDVIVHVGDIQAGGAPCPVSNYQTVKEVLDASIPPVFILPGDNEWNNCSNSHQAAEFWRATFGAFTQERWSSFAHERDPQQHENFSFVLGDLLVVGVAALGDLGSGSDSAWLAMLTKSEAWIASQLAAHPEVSGAVVFGHTTITTNKPLPDQREHSSFKNSVYEHFGKSLAASAKSFGRPVLYVYGDFHRRRLCPAYFLGQENLGGLNIGDRAPYHIQWVPAADGAPARFDLSHWQVGPLNVATPLECLPATTAKLHKGLTRNRQAWQDTIVHAGKRYDGLGMHAPVDTGVFGTATFALPEGVKGFTATAVIGYDTRTGPEKCANSENKGQVRFRVRINGEVRFDQEIKGRGAEGQVSIRRRPEDAPWTSLELGVENFDGPNCDHSTWLLPMIHFE